MKKLEDYAEEISKCSKCGMCQAVCPLYKLTGNDCAVSKGKFVMLEGVVKGDLTLNKTINKYLEMCLKCGKCADFCPGGIDVCEIFRTAKHDYLQKSNEGLLITTLYSKHIFDNIIKTLSVLTLNKFKEIIPPKPLKKLLFFKGCANNVIPSSNRAIIKIFKNLNYEIKTEDFNCCGVPFLSSGNLERAEETQNYNTNLINNSNCDFVVTDCASCFDALKKYKNIGKEVITFTDFFAAENLKFEFKKPLKVTFHKPCHLKNYEAVKKVLSNCKNLEYTEMKDFDACCGFAGQFAVTNRKYSLAISKEKAKNALDTEADIILTACPACKLGLKQGLIANKIFNKKVMNITAFLANADRIYKADKNSGKLM